MSKNNLNTYSFYKEEDGKEVLKHTETHQKTDECVFKYLHKAQSQSVHWAVNYGGWRIEITDESTQKTSNYEVL